MKQFLSTCKQYAAVILLGAAIGLGVSALLLSGRPYVHIFLWNAFNVSVPIHLLTHADDAALSSNIGDYYFNSGGESEDMYDLGKARSYYGIAATLNPTLPHPWYQLGRIDFLNSSHELAIIKFNTNIELYNGVENQDVMRTHYMRGLTYGYMKKFEEAEADFKKILEWHEDKPPISEEWALYVDLSWIYFQQGKYKDMEVLTKEGLSRYPDNPWVLNLRGLSLLNLDRESEARPILEQALKEAQKLVKEDWTRAYPGNDPRIADQGLASMITALEYNISLVVDK